MVEGIFKERLLHFDNQVLKAYNGYEAVVKVKEHLAAILNVEKNKFK